MADTLNTPQTEVLRSAVRSAIVDNLPTADAYLENGRSSMPIYIDDAMALIAAAGEWLISADAAATPTEEN